MTSVFIIVTLAIIVYSLWVRRETWWSPWENAASLAVALEGWALLLMSPWAGATIGPVLHHGLGVWNVPQLIGHICLITAVTATIQHMLVRLADPDQVRILVRRQLMLPICLSFAVMVPAYLRADQEYHPDIFAVASADPWLTLYELVGSALRLYLGGYLCRLMLTLRKDPRAKTTIDLYLVSAAFAAAACLALVGAVWVDGRDAGPVVWACLCLSVGVFAYGSARSWQAKSSWFTSGGDTVVGAR